MAAAAILVNFEWPYLRKGSRYNTHRAVIFAIAQLSCLNKNHMSETKQNYDGKPSYSALRLSATVTATKIISGHLDRTPQLSLHIARPIRLK